MACGNLSAFDFSATFICELKNAIAEAKLQPRHCFVNSGAFFMQKTFAERIPLRRLVLARLIFGWTGFAH